MCADQPRVLPASVAVSASVPIGGVTVARQPDRTAERGGRGMTMVTLGRSVGPMLLDSSSTPTTLDLRQSRGAPPDQRLATVEQRPA